MPRNRIRSGVKSTISFLTRQIMLAKKTIADCKTHIARLKRVDKRVRRLGTAPTKKVASRRRKVVKKIAPTKRSIRGRGPNVRDIAYELMLKVGKPAPIGAIAEGVLAAKGGPAGANFKQNLGAALNSDKRFKRVSRGVYGLRRRPTTKKK